MSVKYLVFIFMSVVVVFAASVSPAETIYLNDGRILHEKIIERGSYYIITEADNTPTKYYTGQISRIEEDDPQAPAIEAKIDFTLTEGVPPEKARLITAMLEASGVRSAMIQNIEQVLASAPIERKEELKGVLSTDEIITRLIPVYDKYYSQDDLKAIIQFFRSPTGQKIIGSTLPIMQESAKITVRYLQEKMDQ